MDNTVFESLKDLIEEGKKVRQTNFFKTSIASYIKGPEYDRWISKCIIFLNNHFSEHPLKEDFMTAGKRAPGNGESFFNTMIGVLEAIYEMGELVVSKDITEPIKFNKIFISHATVDQDYVKLIIELLNNIGIRKSNDQIFCSSVPGYDIPLGEPIYDYLKKQFTEDILVIFVLSDNYYNSVACLNEMGATWITSKAYYTILLPSFEFRNIRGAIDPTKISFKMDEKMKLNSFKDDLVKLFDLEEVQANIWENDRDKFLAQIQGLVEKDKYRNKKVQIEVERVKKGAGNTVEIAVRFINNGEIPVQFQEIKITLEDEKKSKLTVSVSEEMLNKYKLFSKENRREVLTFENNTSLDTIRVKNWDVEFYSVVAD